MHFWPFKKSEADIVAKETKNEEPAANKFSQFYVFSQQFNEFINNNMPVGFQQKLEQTKPYIMASFIAWPIFWLYRGLEWSSHRQNARLPMYIQKTYLQAKFMQFSIIMFGLTVASLMENSRTEIVENTSNQIKR
ncbi:uncharacterized protein LOC119606766 [Lucilia sericata]|uniref:uncharacterized protein LOC119606766 n=1 Tax=Lucilia sericata TaxID=13632 RepID=UPI0018A81196|nr:uncharacterized protein LOC119606766 [Lucilia sericata]